MNSNMGENKEGLGGEYQENLKFLREIDLFSGLPLEAIKVFAYLCTRETFKAGEFLFEQDEEDDRAYYVISGRMRLTHKVDGNEYVIRDYGQGEFVGRLALMGNIRHLFSLIAVEDVNCLTITREKFAKALAQFPEVMPKMITVIVGNVYNWEKRYLASRGVECGDCLKEIGVSLV